MTLAQVVTRLTLRDMMERNEGRTRRIRCS
jgi:hypothetical protein